MMTMCDACLADQTRREKESAAFAADRLRRANAQEDARLAHITLTTAPTLEGFRIIRTVGIVSSERVFEPSPMGDAASELSNQPISAEGDQLRDALRSARESCLRGLKREAAAIGATAVIDVRLDYPHFTASANSVMLFIATGNAVVAESFPSSSDGPLRPAIQITNLPFGITDWEEVEATEHEGESGIALWRTRTFGAIRVRMVEYSPGYRADHWCAKGHILLCVEGEIETELRDGRRFHLEPGMSYQVADGAEPHRSSTRTGATLFIVD